MIDFFKTGTDYIFSFYSLGFIMIAGACFSMWEEEQRALSWKLLGLFGLVHGINEWTDLIAAGLYQKELGLFFGSFLLLLSFVFLFEFARSGYRRLQGNGPGRWLFIPLMLLPLLGGLFFGWEGVQVFSRYGLGLTGGLWAAYVFFLIAQRQGGKKGLWLQAGGIGMGLYGLTTGLVVSPIALFPASLLNTINFTQWTGFSIDLLQAAFAVWVAGSIIGYSYHSLREAAEFRSLARRSQYVFWGAVCCLVSILVSGWFWTDFLGRQAGKEIKKGSEIQILTISNLLLDRIQVMENTITLVADSSWIFPALTSKKDLDLERANSVLDQYQKTLGASVCYLLDGTGKAIASSNRNSPESFFGKSYAFRPYFQTALLGGLSRYFALGVTSRERGVYVGFPVREPQGRIVGVVVIKGELDDFEAEIRRIPYAFFIDPNGIIFISSRPNMLIKSLWPIPPEVERRIRESLQFGNQPFPAILSKEPRDGDMIVFQEREFIVSRNLFGGQGWSVVVWTPIDWFSVNMIKNYRLVGILSAFVLSTLFIVIFIGGQLWLEASYKASLSEERFREIFQYSPEAIFIYDKNTRRLLAVNPMMSQWLGYSPEELLRMGMDDFNDPQKQDGLEVRFLKKDGTWVDVLITERPFPFQGQEAVLVIARDISERKRFEEMLEQFSFIDGLTGIANRRRFDEVLEQEWRRGLRERTPMSLILADIDHFKIFNDTYGHQAGDDCLKEVSRVLKETLNRPGDLAARYGGEEFVAILPDTEMEGAYKVAETIRAKIEGLGIPNKNSSVSRWVTISLGLAFLWPSAEQSPSELLSASDQALYQAKAEGRNRVKMFEGKKRKV